MLSKANITKYSIVLIVLASVVFFKLSGHAAVFINWLRDGKGDIVGLKYWSTQKPTNGIAYKKEYFSDNPEEALRGTVNRNQLYIGIVGSIANYRSFKE